MLVIHKKSGIKGLRTMDKKIEITLQEYCTENNREALLETVGCREKCTAVTRNR